MTAPQMLARIAILGATGDLTRRSLAPAIGALLAQGLISASCSITAVGRREWSDREYLDWLTSGPFAVNRSAAGFEQLRKRLRYRAADVTVPSDLRAALAPDE